MNWPGNFAITFVVFMVIDLLWLGYIAKKLYRHYLGSMIKSPPNWTAALLFYSLYIVGMLFFVIHPALAQQSWQYAAGVGAFYGFITYMTYDLTNLATLNNWPVPLTAIDIAWGTFLGSATSSGAYFIISAYFLNNPG